MYCSGGLRPNGKMLREAKSERSYLSHPRISSRWLPPGHKTRAERTHSEGRDPSMLEHDGLRDYGPVFANRVLRQQL